MADSDPVDVCVAGSGAGGGAVALALARAGLRVVVLERGSWVSNGERVHDELRLTRRDRFVPFVSDDPHVMRVSADHPGERTPLGWVSRAVGGGSVRWAGYAFRLTASDMAGWPITPEELAPYYTQAESLLGVDAGGSLRRHPIGQRLATALRQAGLTPITTPYAISTVPGRGHGACIYCDWCSGFPCEVYARGGSAESLLSAAIATGRCEVRSECRALEVTVASNGRARGVIYRNAQGRRVEQQAAIVCLACSAIETARLLLLSQSREFPHGLGNHGGLVGKHFMFMVRGGAASDFLTGSLTPDEQRGGTPFVGISTRLDDRALVVFSFSPPAPIGAAERLSQSGPGGTLLWGQALKDRLRAWYHEGLHVDAETFTPCRPRSQNCIDLSPEVRDAEGVPAARITFALDAAERETSRSAVRSASNLLSAAGAARITGSLSGGVFDVIQAGTCRFGTDRQDSVLDRNCRLHEVDNVYVVDGSFVPTLGAAPLGLTLIANALRVGEHIAKRQG